MEAEPIRARRDRRWVPLALAALIVLQFSLAAWGGLLENTRSNSGDQGAFLLIGLDIREGRALTDGNRHPLYPLLISAFARRAWSYFTYSKLISLLLGIGALAGVLAVGWRQGGPALGLGAGALLSLNQEYLAQTPRVLCEALLVGLVVAAWWAYAGSLAAKDNWRLGAMAGLLVGLVYLCKGTGSLMIVIWGVAAFLAKRRQALTSRSVWALAIALILTALPLMAHNWSRYGHPLYNFNAQHAMWFDSWDDRYLPATQWPTVRSYAASHSLGEAAWRLGRGVLTILPVMAEAWSVHGWAWTGWLLVMAGLAAGGWGIWRMAAGPRCNDQGAIEAGLFGLLLIGFLLFFGWFAPVTDAPRFFLPLAPLALLVVGRRALAWLARRGPARAGLVRSGHQAVRGAGYAALALVMVAASLRSADASLFANPFAHDRQANQAAGDVVSWLNDRAGPDGRVLHGPSHELPKWLFVPGLEPDPIPEGIASWPELLAFVGDHDYDYVVLDKKMYTRRREALEQGLDKNDKVILFREAPLEWQYAYSRRGQEMNWYVLEPNQRARESFDLWPAAAWLGEVSVGEIGVRTVPGSGPATLDITLTWRTLSSMDRNLTVFVHLLGDDQRRVAQSDGYPLGGMYPTSFWQAGESVLDRHTLASGASLRDGAYTLLIGLYDGETHERVAPTRAEGAARLVPHGVVLPLEITDGIARPARGA